MSGLGLHDVVVTLPLYGRCHFFLNHDLEKLVSRRSISIHVRYSRAVLTLLPVYLSGMSRLIPGRRSPEELNRSENIEASSSNPPPGMG